MDRCAISDLICVVHCLKTIMFIFLTCLYFSGSCVFNNALTVPDVAFYGAVSGNQKWHQKQSPHENDMDGFAQEIMGTCKKRTGTNLPPFWRERESENCSILSVLYCFVP